MFKLIPGNYNFIISLNGQIRKADGKESELSIINNKVEIEIFGIKRFFDIDWLALISFFELTLPENCKNKIDIINFKNINPNITKSPTGKIMVFQKPFVIDKYFRLIPGYTNYAITSFGIIKNVKTGEISKISYSGEYPTVSIYSPERSQFKSILVHRLVAISWVSNCCFIDKPIVNHKDGNKQNFHYSNLEWCSYQENSIHAVNYGLRNDNKHYNVKNIETGEIKLYYSFRQVCLDLGLHKDTKFKQKVYKRKINLINNKYEIKEESDDSPWLSDINSLKSKGMYSTEVIYPDKSIEIFNDTRDIIKKLKLWNVGSGIKSLIEKAKQLYPGIKFNIRKNYEIKSVQAYELKTGIIVEANSIRDMSRKLDIDFNVIRNSLNLTVMRICKGYVFRFSSDNPWNMNFENCINKPKKILAINTITNEELKFESLRSASKYFKIERCIITSRLLTGLIFNDWLFKENED